MVLCLLSGAVVMACGMLAQAASERIDPRMLARRAEGREAARHG